MKFGKMIPDNALTMKGVSEFNNDYVPVLIPPINDKDPWILRTYHGDYEWTSINLTSLIEWLKTNKPELLECPTKS